MSERSDTLLEVVDWASHKRDGNIIVPWTQPRSDDKPWSDGYYFAMNDFVQHFNGERLMALRLERSWIVAMN